MLAHVQTHKESLSLHDTLCALIMVLQVLSSLHSLLAEGIVTSAMIRRLGRRKS